MESPSNKTNPNEPTFYYRKYVKGPFNAAACDECGLCLHHCPMMHLPLDKAKAEIKALKEGKGSKKVLTKCTSCFTCNQICPKDARPTNLILGIWQEKYVEEGLPLRADFFLPYSTPNFRTGIVKGMDKKQKETLAKWAEMTPVDEILFPGCNLITTPYLTWSKIFDGITIRGTLNHCCGEMYFRMGLTKQVEQIAQHLTYYLKDQLHVKKVHMMCTAGYNILKNILPQYGADFKGIEFSLFQNTILNKLESGELKITKPFTGKTVSVQDSCHAKMAEPNFSDVPRKILEFIGLKILEAPQTKDTMVCCGIGSGFSHYSAYSKINLIGGMRSAFRNSLKPKTDYVCVYCPGCLEMFSCAKWVNWNATPVFHLLELIQLAIGEKPARKQRKLGLQFFIGALTKQSLSSKSFTIPDIPKE